SAISTNTKLPLFTTRVLTLATLGSASRHKLRAVKRRYIVQSSGVGVSLKLVINLNPQLCDFHYRSMMQYSESIAQYDIHKTHLSESRLRASN
ncbi:MAG: hypothetical protein ACI9WC_002069, partial [Arenicella sp.]